MIPNKEELLDEIAKLKQDKYLIIVEGSKDKIALEKLGLTNIICLSKAPLYQIVEEVVKKAKEVAILTDLDGKGKELYHVLSRDLQNHKVKIDNRLRDKLFMAKISHIEGLATFLM
ncbi:toprim domain-containing protein [Candidatus Woesearchaeota archaeon]|nr:toprim domain-containing protein [Candidatus Woesearchaeota archaeon]